MKKKALLYIVLAIALIGFAVVLMEYNRPPLSVDKEDVAFKVSASELVKAFSSDESGAQRRYVGKIIQVRGRLKELIRSENTVVVRMGDSTEMMGVTCYLSDGEVTTAHLKKGESVTVKGICNGLLMDVVLDDGMLLADGE